jgi:hypothetical protein
VAAAISIHAVLLGSGGTPVAAAGDRAARRSCIRRAAIATACARVDKEPVGHDRYSQPPRRRRGRPIRAFRDAHPTLLWTVVFLLVIAVLVVVTMHRLVLPH